jgi:hypothetical protein
VIQFPAHISDLIVVFFRVTFFFFLFLRYLILHNFMRALCRKTRLKQIVCVHTSDTCEELCMSIHVLFSSFFFPHCDTTPKHTCMNSVISVKLGGKKSFWFHSIHRLLEKKTVFGVCFESLFDRIRGECLWLDLVKSCLVCWIITISNCSFHSFFSMVEK